MRLDVGLPTEIVTAGSDSNVSVCIRLGVEAIQRNNNNKTVSGWPVSSCLLRAIM